METQQGEIQKLFIEIADVLENFGENMGVLIRRFENIYERLDNIVKELRKTAQEM